VLDEEHPPLARLLSLRHEHVLLRELDGDGAVRAHGLQEEGGRVALVLEDRGGTSLKSAGLLGRLGLAEALELAIKLTQALQRVHKHRIIHKDLNPSNILLGADGSVALMDFGISTRLSQETTEFGSPKALEGTLAYIAPEQTGRMNRPIDYRTDYYSLGVTLYELLTGRGPFTTTDPTELVHAHIARQPPSPSELVPSIPRAVSAIVLKLMAKSADDRYQSTRGLLADLRKCLDVLRGGGQLQDFSPGLDDLSERFRIPQKLYGREAELARLMEAFEQARGRPVLATVAGPSGVGKSELVQELHRPLTVQRGGFAAGKFEQYQDGTPYGAFQQALHALAQQFLTESEERLTSVRGRLLASLGGNLRVLADFCPPVKFIVGEHPPVPILGPIESRARFHRALIEFVSTLASPEHPLCLFLDDLQWADLDSLKLLQELLRAGEGVALLVIGAYRDDEVGASHPLLPVLQELEREGTSVHRLALRPLGAEELRELVADTLSASVGDVVSLSEVVLARTGGNPFFVRTFLGSLHAEGLITPGPRGFRWDLESIRQRGSTRNVAELLVSRLAGLPPETRAAIEFAACIGLHFDLDQLGVVMGRRDGTVGLALWAAVEQGLLVVLDRAHSAVELSQPGTAIRCRFVHDRVQQAILDSLPPARLAVMHRDAGTRLLRHVGPEGLQAHLFDIVRQLNLGRAAMTTAEDLDALARYNLQAAQAALASTAAQKALELARAGLALLDAEAWGQRYELTRDLHLVAAEAAFLTGDLDTFEMYFQRGMKNVHTVLEEVQLRKIEGPVRLAQVRITELIHIYLSILERLGFGLPEGSPAESMGLAVGRVEALLAGRTIEELEHLPVCGEPLARAAMEILNRLLPLTFVSTSALTGPVICKLTELSLQHGNTPDSCMGYIFYGVVLSKQGQIERAYRFGRLAQRLSERLGDKKVIGFVAQYANYQLIHWKVPLYELSSGLFEAYRHSVDAGSPYEMASSSCTYCINRFHAGDELGALAEDMKQYGQLAIRLRQQMVVNWHQIHQQTVANLRNDGPEPVRLRGEFYDEEQRVPEHQQAHDSGALWLYHLCKTYLAFLFEDAPAAATHAEAASAYAQIGAEAMYAALWRWLNAMARLGVLRQAAPEEQARLLGIVEGALGELRHFSEHCPKTYEHKIAMIEAERARVLGRTDEAQAGFEKAVELARRSGYLQEHAVASELAGRFYLEQGEQRVARVHLREAHMAWLRWGAVAKAKRLEQQYPYLLPRVATGTLGAATLSANRSGEWDFNVLDLVSVLDASQTLSREVDLQRLLERLMQLLVENSGAEVGYLLVERNGQWVVEAGGGLERERVPSLQSIPMAELERYGARGLAQSVVLYVARTQQSVVLDDARTSTQFGKDPHIASGRPRSILCFMMAGHVGRRGLVYLENGLTQGAFTPGRIKILQLLSTQAVISLENAELYGTLEKKVHERTLQLQTKNQELASALEQLREAQDRMMVQNRLAALGALTTGIAHELRNPLNFINNFAGMSMQLVEEVATELAASLAAPSAGVGGYVEQTLADLRTNLTTINQHSRRMEGIIRSMLDHSRGGQGKAEETDLKALVTSFVNVAHQAQRTKLPVLDVALELVMEPELGRVVLVPQEISRVILNLVENAWHAVRARAQRISDTEYRPRIRVSTHGQGDAVELRVWDNGTGIPKAMLHRIFEPFFTTKPTGEGTGLGLSICYDIVVQGHRGSLHCSSQEGEFTEFTVRLPHRRV
jgi:predicted ATPase/signal transduction histidine kinase